MYMNGLWKESVGGWNHKDTKRKKQKRKHTIRDKGRGTLKAAKRYSLSNRIYREEGLVDVTYVEKKEYFYTAKLYRGTFYYPKVDETGNFIKNKYGNQEYVYKTIVYYFDDNDKSFKDRDGKVLFTELVQKQKINMRVLINVDLNINVKLYPVISRETKTLRNVWMGSSKEYLYNKLVLSTDIKQLYRDWSRKWARTYANRLTRNRVKQWIRNADFDKEIKNHSYEKSIEYLIS